MTTPRKRTGKQPAKAAAPPAQPAPSPAPAPEPPDRQTAAAQAGVARYVPQAPQRDLSDYGGSRGGSPGLSKPGPADLLEPSDVLKSFDPDDVLTDHQAIELYNDGITVEQFFKTPMGKKLQAYIDQDIQLYGEMAVASPTGLDDANVKSQYRLACAAHYVRDFFMDMLGKAAQAEQLLNQRDEGDGHPESFEPEG